MCARVCVIDNGINGNDDQTLMDDVVFDGDGDGDGAVMRVRQGEMDKASQREMFRLLKDGESGKGGLCQLLTRDVPRFLLR